MLTDRREHWIHAFRLPARRRFCHRASWAKALACALVLTGAPGVAAIARAAASIDPALYGALLDEHTTATEATAGVLVDYRRITADGRWETLLGQVRGQQLEGLSRSETLAFWINAYNILTIDLVARNFPVSSIRDIGSFFRPVWDRPAGVAAGEERTLGDIEHEILRKLGEPRTHAAIVCASTSCPPLPRTPFVADELDAQLDAAARTWLASDRKGARLDRTARKLTLSAIFDWFEEDFESEGGVRSFVARYLEPADAAWLRAQGDSVSVDHFDYDWGVNHWAR